MDADLKGCLINIDKSWKIFHDNGKPMTKIGVTTLLCYGLNKGYKTLSQFTKKDYVEVRKVIINNEK